MQTNNVQFKPRNMAAAPPRTAPQAPPTPEQMKELFTPEALEACPYARAMFEQMKELGNAQPPSLQQVTLAEPNSLAQQRRTICSQAGSRLFPFPVSIFWSFGGEPETTVDSFTIVAGTGRFEAAFFFA